VPAKFVLSRARGGKFRFELVASNGKVLAQSTPHDTKRAAVSALRSVQKNAATDVVDDQTEPAKKATTTKAAAAKTTTAPRSTAGKTTARKTATRKTATGQAAATSASATTKPLATARKTAPRKRVAATGAAARATRA